MANLTPYLTEKYNKLIAEVTADLSNTLDRLNETQTYLRGLKNPDMIVNGGPVTLDRIQVMENGDIRLLPPPPAPITETCVKAPEPDRNGKKAVETKAAESVAV